jgi:hypothetical protein
VADPPERLLAYIHTAGWPPLTAAGCSTMTTADQLAARAMALSTGACDDDLAVAELCRLAVGNDQALDQAILACLAQPASLAARHLAIELLARALYELLAATHHGHGQVRPRTYSPGKPPSATIAALGYTGPTTSTFTMKAKQQWDAGALDRCPLGCCVSDESRD